MSYLQELNNIDDEVIKNYLISRSMKLDEFRDLHKMYLVQNTFYF